MTTSKPQIQLSPQVKESNKTAKNGVVILLGTMLAQGLSIVATLWIARTLGPDQYGLLFLGISILLPIITVSTFGLNVSVVRFIPIHVSNNENDRVIGTLNSALMIGGVFSILLVIILISTSSYLAGQIFSDLRLSPVLKILALTIPLITLINIMVAGTRGLHIMHIDAGVQVIKPIIRILVFGSGLFLVGNLFSLAMLASVLNEIVALLVATGLTYLAFKHYRGLGVKWDLRNIFVYSLPILLTTLMYTISPKMETLVLGFVSDTQVVGIYSVATSLVIVLRMIHQSAVKLFSPMVADAYNRHTEEMAQNLFLLTARWDSRLTFISVIIACAIIPEVFSLLGEEYLEAIYPFIILAISVYVGTLLGPTGAFLQMTNQQKVDAFNAVVFFVISPLIQIKFVLWFGWQSAAWATLLSIIILNLIQFAEIYYLYRFHPLDRNNLLFIFISFTLMALMLSVLSYSLLTRIIVLSLILISFCIVIFLLRDDSDKLLFKKIPIINNFNLKL